MMHLAVMQGRLSLPEDGRIQCFPRSSWREEFPRAREAGIPALEWIDDLYGAEVNPLRSLSGIQELRTLMDRYGVVIPSVCADTFMEEPLVRCTELERDERLDLLRFILTQGRDIGAKHVDIPFLDNSALQNPDEIEEAATALQQIFADLDRLTMELHLETSLDPSSFRAFLDLLDHPLVRVTYDTGNSASLGYNPREEFAAYGDRIGSVHIKDRKRDGGTVRLGSGETSFAIVAEELQHIRFAGPFTLQAARGKDGEEKLLLREYREFTERIFGNPYLQQHHRADSDRDRMLHSSHAPSV